MGSTSAGSKNLPSTIFLVARASLAVDHYLVISRSFIVADWNVKHRFISAHLDAISTKIECRWPDALEDVVLNIYHCFGEPSAEPKSRVHVFSFLNLQTLGRFFNSNDKFVVCRRLDPSMNLPGKHQKNIWEPISRWEFLDELILVARAYMKSAMSTQWYAHTASVNGSTALMLFSGLTSWLSVHEQGLPSNVSCVLARKGFCCKTFLTWDVHCFLAVCLSSRSAKLWWN